MRTEQYNMNKHQGASVVGRRLAGWTKFLSAASLAASVLLGTRVSQAADPGNQFDWSVNATTGSDGNYTPAPFLTDQNAASVAAFLATRVAANSNAPLAVKINGPISNATAQLIFGHYSVKYVFADFEGSNALAQTTTLVNQVHSQAPSKNAFIGEFNLYNVPVPDGTRGNISTTATSFKNIYSSQNYKSAGVNMSNESAYPGSPDFALPGHGTTSPNIRSALFVLPVDRVTFITDFATIGYYPATNTPPA